VLGARAVTTIDGDQVAFETLWAARETIGVAPDVPLRGFEPG
jgi:hypothetical protein